MIHPYFRWWELLEHPEAKHPRVAGDGLDHCLLRVWRSCFIDDAYGFALFDADDPSVITSISIRLADSPVPHELIPITQRLEFPRHSIEPALNRVLSATWPPPGELPSIHICVDGYTCGAARGGTDEHTVQWSEGNPPPECDEWETKFLELYAALRRLHELP